MPNRLFARFFPSLFVISGAFAQNNSWILLSPDQAVEATVRLADSGGVAGYPAGTRLYYSIRLGGQEVVPLSPLGLTRSDQNFVEGLVLDSAGSEKILDENYTMVSGKRSLCRNHARERILHFRNASGAKLQLVMRAYPDGFAFRYVFPETNATKLTVTGETTGFRLPSGSQAWMLPYDTVATWSPAYENEWNKTTAGTASPGPQGWCLPALFKTPANAWVLLAETEVTETYCGTHLAKNAPNSVYRITFPAANELGGQGAVNPSWTLPWAMPWRIVLVGKSPGVMVESTVFTDLASPSTVSDASWIKPGRASWSWWSDGGSPRIYASLTPFVDLSQQMAWEYSLVDANWNEMTGGTWQGLVNYAKPKNVGITLWYNSAGPYNGITEQPRDKIFDATVRKSEFQAVSQAGVKGLKIDFWMSDKQIMMQYYLDVFKDAGASKLVLNLHGSTIPRGWQRTYPHLLTAEAIKGAEEYKFSSAYSAPQPGRNTIFPFTRNTVASMDYTPLTFSNTTQKTVNGSTYYARTTSHGHELALSVVFESGLQHFADQVSGYTSLPAYVTAFLKHVPAAWDETRYLQGEPGTSVMLARRKGQDWYIGGINGEGSAKEISQSLFFLGNYAYSLEWIGDGANKTSFSTKSSEVNANDTLKASLLAHGGFVAYLKQLRPVSIKASKPAKTSKPTTPLAERKARRFDATGRKVNKQALPNRRRFRESCAWAEKPQ